MLLAHIQQGECFSKIVTSLGTSQGKVCAQVKLRSCNTRFLSPNTVAHNWHVCCCHVVQVAFGFIGSSAEAGLSAKLGEAGQASKVVSVCNGDLRTAEAFKGRCCWRISRGGGRGNVTVACKDVRLQLS